jgi:hypothetical protein
VFHFTVPRCHTSPTLVPMSSVSFVPSQHALAKYFHVILSFLLDWVCIEGGPCSIPNMAPMIWNNFLKLKSWNSFRIEKKDIARINHSWCRKTTMLLPNALAQHSLKFYNTCQITTLVGETCLCVQRVFFCLGGSWTPTLHPLTPPEDWTDSGFFIRKETCLCECLVPATK